MFLADGGIMDPGNGHDKATLLLCKPAAVLPAEPFVWLGGILAVDERKQVHAVGWLSLGHSQTGGGHQRGKNVHARDHFTIDLSDRCMLGPTDDHRHAHPTLEDVELVSAERLVVGIVSRVGRV